MDLIQLILISLIQGISEFLPISSSAHLVLLPKLMSWNDQGLSIDIAAHLGSLLAVIYYFRTDFINIVVNGFGPVFGSKYARVDYKLFWLIILASLPALIGGFIFHDVISTYLRNPLVVAFTTIFFGFFLWISDIVGKKSRKITTITKKDALIIGLSQVLSLIPGTSRSGITMTTGLLLGLDRQTAIKFSFFMSVPIISMAALYEAWNLIQDGELIIIKDFLITIFFSATSSFFTIHFFLKFIDKIGMIPFVIYRLILGITLLFIFL